jgi:membrane fusion protein, macrolide-specific efflux system
MVMVYDQASGRVQPKPVTVGINNGVSAEIEDGLSEGDLVVTTSAAAPAAAASSSAPGGMGAMGGMGGPPPGL